MLDRSLSFAPPPAHCRLGLVWPRGSIPAQTFPGKVFCLFCLFLNSVSAAAKGGSERIERAHRDLIIMVAKVGGRQEAVSGAGLLHRDGGGGKARAPGLLRSPATRSSTTPCSVPVPVPDRADSLPVRFTSRSWCVRARVCVCGCVWSQMTMSAEDLKQEGNALYKQGLYLKAAATYTSAIKLDKENGVLYR